MSLTKAEMSYIIGQFFPVECEFDRQYCDHSVLHKYNVVFHSTDKIWLKKYILNNIYSGGYSSLVLEVHDFLNSNEYEEFLKNFQNKLIESTLKKVLNSFTKINISKIGLTNAEMRIRNSVRNLLVDYYNMDEKVFLSWYNTNKEKVYQQIKNKSLNENIK